MTEAEWFACGNPEQMLDFLKKKANDRKLRMFAVACCYICRRGEANERLEGDYEAVVRFVDGTGSLEEVRSRWQPPANDEEGTWPERPFVWARDFASIASHPEENEDRYEHFPTAPRNLAADSRSLWEPVSAGCLLSFVAH